MPLSRNRIVRADAGGTVLFVAADAMAIIEESARTAAAIVALVLFVAGCVAMLAAFAKAVSRSRTDAIGIGGLYFLAGDTAPDQSTARTFQVLFAVQCAVALAAAAARPFTSLAFGILVPVYGLGLMGVYGAYYGRFGPR